MRNIVTPSIMLLAIGALSACGSGGPSVPGSVANASGGGAPISGTQSASAFAFPPILLDGGIVSAATYTGVNVTAADTQSSADAYSDLYTSPNNSTKFAYEPPTNPAGSHLITFSTNAPMTEEIFQLAPHNATAPLSLTFDSTQAGVSTSTTYAAVVFYLGPLTNVASTTNFDIEVSGGFAATAYDVRIGCAQQNASGNSSPLVSNTNPASNKIFSRYICAIPKYGAPSGLYATVLSSTLTASPKFIGATILNPVIPGAAGTFAPTVTSYPYPAPTPISGGASSGSPSPTIDLVLDQSGTTTGTSAMAQPATASASFSLDYMYAEALNY